MFKIKNELINNKINQQLNVYDYYYIQTKQSKPLVA